MAYSRDRGREIQVVEEGDYVARHEFQAVCVSVSGCRGG